MARRPPDDPRVTDLSRYRKAREQNRRPSPTRPPQQQRHRLLGSNPRAGLILTLVAVAAIALFVLPQLR